jgi:hypothetical protein
LLELRLLVRRLRALELRLLELRLLPPPLRVRGGTFAPRRRASESPMAMACSRLFTFFFERPERSVPCFASCSARPTFFEAASPYRRVLPRFLPLLPPVLLLRLLLDRLLLLVAISTPHLFPELVGEEAPGAEPERSLARRSEPASGPVVAAAEGAGSSAGGGIGKPLAEFERPAQCALASAQSARLTH